MDAMYGGNPPGLSDAEAGIRYVRMVIGELESMARALPRLVDMNWRSRAADKFAAVLQERVTGLRRSVDDFETAAEALTRYADELRALGRGED